MNLSKGALLKILTGDNAPEKPIFQVINARKIPSPNSTDRYRLLLSDGENMYSHVMLAAQLNKLMESNDVEPNAVIEIAKYMCNTVQGDKRVIIVLELNVVAKGSDVTDRIGNPVQLNPSDLGKTTQSAPKTVSNNAAGMPTEKPVLKPNHQNTSNNNVVTVSKSSTPSTPGNTRVHSIASLTPYQNRWRIRARVTMKSNIRTWNNARGEGRLFNVNLLDDSGEIRCTGFNEQVDKFYGMLEVNKIYYFSKCTLKTANKQYSNLNNEYEMTMNSETLIEPCGDDVDLPTLTFDFVKISGLESREPNSNVDVIGVVKVCNDVGTVIGRASQKEITKRDLQIVDQSGVAVNLTLWGEDAVKFDGNGYPIVAVKGARLSDFHGRSLSVSNSSQMLINPDVKDAHILRGWFDKEGRNMSFSSYQNESGGSSGAGPSNWKTFAQVKSENLGQGEKADYFTVKGTVIFVKKDNCMYQACPSENCNKKLIDQGNGLYRCEKCNQECPNFKWRMILQANIADHSDNQWVTCFQESAECILGTKADELGAMREENEMQFDQVIHDAIFKSYIFRMRAKMETYNEESRLKTVCVQATPVDWVDYGNQLVQQLANMGM